MYNIVYLPIAKQDIEQIMMYISDCLATPQAALDLLGKMEHVIAQLQTFPFAYPVYESPKALDFVYRVIPVKNYLIFYVVAENVVQIHRVIYAKMDLIKLLK